MFTDIIFKWLDSALDYGISEYDFWNMTFAELTRLIASKRRIEKAEAQKKANFDYILAGLIGRNVGMLLSKQNTVPTIEEVYPSLFETQEIQEEKQKQQDEKSAIRFKQFANSFNKKFEQEVANKE